MADLYPLANGNWSTATNWYNAATGTTVNRLPNSGGNIDNVWLNNKTIVIDTNATCDKLSNKAFTGAGFSPVAGGKTTIALSNTFSPTVTVGTGGIESSQLTTAGNTIEITGSPTAQPSVCQILCTGDITGGFSSVPTSHAIIINCTNSKIYITADEILSGITSNSAYAIHIPSASTGNTIYINCNKITGGTAAAINNNTTSGVVVYKATTIEGGNSIAAINQQNENISQNQYVGYTWDFTTSTPTASEVTDIIASATSPAIQSLNKTQFIIKATNINGNSNGIDALMLFKALLDVTNIKYYATPTTFAIYQNQTPSASTAAEFWDYFENNPDALSKITRLHNTSTVQTTGDQLASYNT
jgi:hypothetical protein